MQEEIKGGLMKKNDEKKAEMLDAILSYRLFAVIIIGVLFVYFLTTSNFMIAFVVALIDILYFFEWENEVDLVRILKKLKNHDEILKKLESQVRNLKNMKKKMR